MTIQNAQVAVTTAAVSLATGGSNGIRINLTNTGPQAVLIGGGTAGLGTAGYQLGSANSISLALEQWETLYGVTASGTANVHVLKSGV